MNESGQIIERQVHNFSEIPKYLLENPDKMGIDSSLILNEYEGKYLNFIFKIDLQDLSLVGKKVSSGSKKGFFNDEKEWFYRGEKSGVGGSALYILLLLKKRKAAVMTLQLCIGVIL